MISEKRGIRRYKVLRGARAAPKVSRKHTKNCAPEFLILSALKVGSPDPVVFIDIKI